MRFTTSHRLKVLGLGLVVLAGLALPACDLGGSPIFNVDVLTDGTDVSIGDGNCNDGTGHCPLHAAVQESNALSGRQKITLTAGQTYTLTITGSDDTAAAGDLDVNDDLQLSANGATISASGLGDRAIDSRLGRNSFDRVTVSGGSAASGAGIRQTGGEMLIDWSTITANTASNGAGGIQIVSGSVLIGHSTVSGNAGTTAGGIGSAGALNLYTSTVSGNTASGGTGGGVAVTGGTADFRQSTIADNTGGGLQNGATTSMRNSIIAVQDTGDDCTGTAPTSNGYNLDSDGECSLGGTGDVTDDPALGPLQDNSGPTATQSPGPDSPAIDAVPDAACELTDDQRGIARPSGRPCDMGAVEAFVEAWDVNGEIPGGWIDAYDSQPTWWDDVEVLNGSLVTPNPDTGPILQTTNSGARAAVYKQFPSTYAEDVRVGITWSGDNPYEATPLIHVNPDDDAYGIGAWPIGAFQGFFIGEVGRRPDQFFVYEFIPFTHVDETPRRIELRSTGTHFTVWLGNLSTGELEQYGGEYEVPEGLQGSSKHGVAIDINQDPNRPANTPVAQAPFYVTR